MYWNLVIEIYHFSLDDVMEINGMDIYLRKYRAGLRHLLSPIVSECPQRNIGEPIITCYQTLESHACLPWTLWKDSSTACVLSYMGSLMSSNCICYLPTFELLVCYLGRYGFLHFLLQGKVETSSPASPRCQDNTRSGLWTKNVDVLG